MKIQYLILRLLRVSHIFWTSAERFSGNSSGTKLPQHRIIINDCDGVIVSVIEYKKYFKKRQLWHDYYTHLLDLLISFKIDSISRLDIRPVRLNS